MTPQHPTAARTKSQDAIRKAKQDKRQQRRDLIKDVSRIALLVGFFLLSIFAIKWMIGGDLSSKEGAMAMIPRIKDLLHPEDSISGMLKSYAVFILLGTIFIGAGLPRWIICVFGGGIYGAVLGTALSTVATQAGAQVTYYMGSSMLKGTVKRRFGHRFAKIQEKVRRNGFSYAVNARLFPGTPALLTSLLCGAVQMRLRDYNAANLIGFFPQTLIVCLLASGATKMNSGQVVISLALFVLFFAGNKWFRQKAKEKERAQAGAESSRASQEHIHRSIRH